MKTIGAYEAETRFRELLADVAKGETIIVTEEDEPVAQISPVHRVYANAAEAIDDWRRYRREKNITLGEGVTIRELIEEGRE
ncbi:MAG: type II toxin-antitoxin system Phd/YefM family antitoxin [Thermomicrobiales bacterium]